MLGAAAGSLVAVPVVVAALLVRSRWDPLIRVDRTIADELYQVALDRPDYAGALKVGAVVLDPWSFRVAALALFVVLLRRGAHRLAWFVAVTTIAGGLTGVVVKALVARARPVFPDPVHLAPSWSFPSGHALNAALITAVFLLVLLPVLRRTRWRVTAWLVGALLVLATGYDRIGIGAHYLSDVLAGYGAAAAVVVATGFAFEAWQRVEKHEVGHLRSGIDPEESEKLT